MNMRTSVLAGPFLAFFALPLAAQAPPAAPAADHVAAIKQSLAASNAALRQYEWIETTAVSIKGEEKSRTQAKCYYGVDGKVQKVPVGAAPEEKSPRGLRGKIAENKKEEISDSMKEAIALVKQYVPPQADLIDAAKAAGRLSIVPPDSQGNVKVVIKDYLKSGDSLTLAANATTNRIGGVTVATYTDKAKEAVDLQITFGAFPDGTVFASKINLGVKKENLDVVIENSGYKKAGS